MGRGTSWQGTCFLGLPFHCLSPRLPGALSACEGPGRCGSPLPEDVHLGTGPFILIPNSNSGIWGHSPPAIGSTAVPLLWGVLSWGLGGS